MNEVEILVASLLRVAMPSSFLLLGPLVASLLLR